MIQKILPGVYTEVVAGERERGLGIRGVVTMPLELSWGEKVTEIIRGQDTFAKLGYYLNDPKMKLVREVMNYADKLILYRLNTGIPAQGALSDTITAKAVYGGARGNDLSVVVQKKNGAFSVKTFVGTLEVDHQIIQSVENFRTNNFISITGTGDLADATVKLSAGSDGAADENAFENYFTELEKRRYNFIAYTGTDESEKTQIIDFVERMRENNVMVQTVMSGSGFDNIALVNNTIGGKTAKYELTAAEACATMAGIQAKLGISGSATNFDVTGWTEVEPHLNQIQMETRTQNGETLFVSKHDRVMVLYDINSLTTYTDEHPQDFHKNLVIRTLDAYAMDLQELLDTRAIGKIRNSVTGRNQIKGMIVDMTMANYVAIDAVEGFESDDVVVEQGAQRDEVIATVGIRVVDTVDKIYITVTSL